MSIKADVVVLGAGIVGVSAALHLQERGRDVVVVERAPKAGMGTSYGNAGLIERSSIFPDAGPATDAAAALTKTFSSDKGVGGAATP